VFPSLVAGSAFALVPSTSACVLHCLYVQILLFALVSLFFPSSSSPLHPCLIFSPFLMKARTISCTLVGISPTASLVYCFLFYYQHIIVRHVRYCFSIPIRRPVHHHMSCLYLANILKANPVIFWYLYFRAFSAFLTDFPISIFRVSLFPLSPRLPLQTPLSILCPFVLSNLRSCACIGSALLCGNHEDCDASARGHLRNAVEQPRHGALLFVS